MEATSAETKVVEELIPVKPENINPVSATEKESIPTAASSLPLTVTEEHVEAKQGKLVSFEVDTIAKSEKASVSVEEDILEFTTEIGAVEPEMVQSSPVEDVRSSAETDVQDVSPATDAVPAACLSETYLIETKFESIMATEKTSSETAATKNIATEDVQVSTVLIGDTDVRESIANEEMPVYELEEGIVPSAPTTRDTAAEGTLVTKELVAETAAPPVAVEELISFETTASLVLDLPVPVQTFPDLALDPLLDPLEDAMPALKPVPAREPEQEEQTKALPVKSEDNMDLAVPLQAEPEVVSPLAAPVAEEADPEGAEEPAEDLEAEMNEILDDLDLDNFDLEDIDTTDINLDEDFE
ncbi:hypothetical protein FQN60_004595 [Etheostoma spectabile]|uniref:Uncharacterized protein n=2 Tax=Etheostoma spectabile TaxID=54343 RepID=A0A5J5DKE5_9PERO|nr:hypothetical protein FQN60_004595 [Etheostoma spectabile]